ncbi:methyltransferase domain-containing protein [Nocardioides sp. C4-1]|uniref:class I SAM-dependent methyltransferase n=1 Tax=Nocardioides sp. C4-1 TaxID=3151851 RepID=UPI0032635C25
MPATRVRPELIPEIDHVLLHDGRVRTIPEAVGTAAGFDWVMASHVIEHVPDVIGWLAQVAEVTAPGGALVLVVPDRRYCFDVHRPGTTTGQLIQSHELGETVPSVRAVFDYKRGHAVTDVKEAWAGRPPGYDRRIYSLDQVVEQVDLARSGEYVDAHVWTFTPGSLVEQLVELRALGLSRWRVETYTETRQDELEFFVVLRQLPAGEDWSDLLRDEPVPDVDMPDWLAAEVRLRGQLHQAHQRLRRRRDRIARLEHRLGRAESRLRARDTELGRIRGSWQWRVGRWVLGPVRRARRIVRRGDA